VPKTRRRDPKQHPRALVRQPGGERAQDRAGVLLPVRGQCGPGQAAGGAYHRLHLGGDGALYPTAVLLSVTASTPGPT
jgi:hypothetical protein